MLEDVACLFVATSRVGLGLRMICENLIAVKFQQTTGYLNVSWAWKAIIASCVMEIMYRRSRCLLGQQSSEESNHHLEQR